MRKIYQCLSRGRDKLYADAEEYIVTARKDKGARRVKGNLWLKDFRGIAQIWRENFDVKVQREGRFAVDIGTGSGVKVWFNIAKSTDIVEEEKCQHPVSQRKIIGEFGMLTRYKCSLCGDTWEIDSSG